MMRLVWAPHARTDLREIASYIARDNPVAARKHVERLRARARQAVQHPQLGRQVPELDDGNIRELIEGNYRIVYQVHDRQIEILTVFEGHRLLRIG